MHQKDKDIEKRISKVTNTSPMLPPNLCSYIQSSSSDSDDLEV